MNFFKAGGFSQQKRNGEKVIRTKKRKSEQRPLLTMSTKLKRKRSELSKSIISHA